MLNDSKKVWIHLRWISLTLVSSMTLVIAFVLVALILVASTILVAVTHDDVLVCGRLQQLQVVVTSLYEIVELEGSGNCAFIKGESGILDCQVISQLDDDFCLGCVRMAVSSLRETPL